MKNLITIFIKLIFTFGFVFHSSYSMNQESTPQNQTHYKMVAAGIIPFFDDGTVLLGKEYRIRYSSFLWMEFGGQKDPNETLAQTAYRETNEETAGTLEAQITLESVQQAEENDQYIDYINPETAVFYRMYFVRIHGKKPSIETFHDNAKKLGPNADVEKVDWKYFDASVIMNAYNQDSNLPGTNEKVYSTFKTRLGNPKTQQFFRNFIASVKTGDNQKTDLP